MTTVACPVCGAGTTATNAFSPTLLRRCERCGLYFRDDVDAVALDRMYDRNEYAVERMGAHTRHRRFDARKRAWWVRASVQGTRLLDVGAGTGFFVAAADACGFEALGIEPSELSARFGREHLGVDVRTGYLEQEGIAAGTFDVVSMWHVLEHVRDPVGFLRNARDRLRTGGTLVLEVPNIESVGAELFRGRWAHLDPRAHVCHFTPRSLTVALSRAGFEALDISTLLENYYDSPQIRWRPRRIAGRIVRSARLRTVRLTHPRRGELLRALARPGSVMSDPASARQPPTNPVSLPYGQSP